MSETFFIKRNDTSPALVRTLEAPGAGTLAGATVWFYMADRAGDLIVSRQCSVIDAGERRVAYEWQAGDTEAAGRFKAEFEVINTDGTKETFPNDGYLLVIISADLSEPPS